MYKVFLQFFALLNKKFPAAGHPAMFQANPKRSMTFDSFRSPLFSKLPHFCAGDPNRGFIGKIFEYFK